MHLTTFVTLLLSCRISAPASTLPIPTSDPAPSVRDPNTSYGLMTHAFPSHGFMTHGLKIQGSLPVDNQNTTTQGTWPETGGYAQSYPNQSSFLNSTQRLAVLQPGSIPNGTDSPVGSLLGGPKPRSKSGLGPDFRLQICVARRRVHRQRTFV